MREREGIGRFGKGEKEKEVREKGRDWKIWERREGEGGPGEGKGLEDLGKERRGRRSGRREGIGKFGKGEKGKEMREREGIGRFGKGEKGKEVREKGRDWKIWERREGEGGPGEGDLGRKRRGRGSGRREGVGASLFSSNIGSEHFVGLAGTGAAAGIAMILYEWSSMLLVICLAWFFLPVYVSAGVYTLPEYMAKRFGGSRLRIYLSCLSLILYIFTKLAVSIYAGALFINLALGWDMYLSIAGILCITGLYTVLGGLAAVIYTDTLQTVIMTIGAIILAVISFDKIGGYQQLQHRYMAAMPSVLSNQSASCALPPEDAFHIFRDPLKSDNPWPGLLLQSSLGCLWYWCCDQVIVQRSLAAKNLSHAKAGSILAGYLKITPLFFMVFPGMISRALFPDMVACVDPETCEQYCENPVGCSNVAYPKLVLELMPVGLRGLLMAVMLSAIMSSLTSIFNSSATLFTMDLWRRMRTQASQRELLIVGRLFVLLLCGVAILWIPMVRSSQGGQLFNYIQAVQGYLGTPIGALFVMAIVWKRMNETGAFFGILTGHLCGAIRMAIDFTFPAPGCVIFSYTAAAPSEEDLYGVTWWTRVDLKRNRQEEEGEEEEKAIGNNSMEMKGMNSHREENVDTKTEDDSDDSYEVEEGECHQCFDKVCGIPLGREKFSTAPDITLSQRRTYLRENPNWRAILNINATIGLAVVAFLIGYYK
ncbi:sodium/glucose cotransporter 4 [Plakobranchus ocellatus]|uniref:Sodium/myo-inositol cotransporter 2 n=1 Tax=Plakobranchus ocellatus TaxID=259542 RepID=A0AAV4E0H4_9GAST|nr:sodium/glucose cotransporter 4 [Plakobranchus ocellatus]